MNDDEKKALKESFSNDNLTSTDDEYIKTYIILNLNEWNALLLSQKQLTGYVKV